MQSAHLIVIQTFLCKPKSSLHVSKQFFKYKRNLYTTNWLNFFEWTAMESIYFWSWEIVTFDWIFVCWWWSRTEFIYQKELWWTHVIGSFFTYCVFQLEYTWKFLLLLDWPLCNVLKKLGNSHEVFNSNAEPWTERQMVKISLSLEKWWYRLSGTAHLWSGRWKTLIIGNSQQTNVTP